VLHAATQQYQIQIVTTTHSRECVAAAYEALGSELQLMRLETIGEESACVIYSEGAIAGAMAMHLEVR